MYVIATAGHVDHGKSTLVRALTGIEPDRWAEERRRGMTIDLGFAWTTLPSGRRLAFVDVPGHERFVTNMLAGLGPVPAVMFVLAADQGWQAQSQEHWEAIEALGVERGLLVVTRCDLMDPALAVEEAGERVPWPVVQVSGSTGRGSTSCGSRSTGWWRGCPRPTSGLRCGCGSTGRSPSGAPGPSSRARCRRGGCGWGTCWCWTGSRYG
ncbi:GTP-binding protein [Nonomuraea thailandensis]